METRLRMELIRARLPVPCVQADIADAAGNFIGRADLYYPDRRRLIEYDGENHKDRLVAERRRQNIPVKASHNILQFTWANFRTLSSVPTNVTRRRAAIPNG